MLQYVIAGLALGSIYSIVATGLVVTYQSAGVLNFSFGAIAYFIARFYYYLNSEHHWSVVPAAIVSILITGPLLGLVLYALLFRFLRAATTLVRIMATIGVSVALPPAAILIFGNRHILNVPGLAPQPVAVYHLNGVPITLDQLIIYGCVVLLLVCGFFVLRYTDIGLRIRALVDSPAMTSLSGANPGRMSAIVWAVSTTLAGLSGVLVAPIVGLDAGSLTIVMTAAFAAVVAAKLRSLPIAAAAGLAMGILLSLLQYWLSASSDFTAYVLEAVPFIVMVVFLLYYAALGQTLDEGAGIGGALDRAIRPQGDAAVTVASQSAARQLSWRPSAVGFVILLIVPLLLNGFWVGLFAQGLAYSIIFLSFTLVTGEGGMIWLCQATFAGAGGMAAALIAMDDHVPILLAVLIGGLVAVPFGILVGLVTIRMGDLYVAVTTLTFGLLIENTLFTRQIFFNFGAGTAVSRPSFVQSDLALVYLGIFVFFILAVFVVNLRQSTTGLGLSAVRSSPNGSRTTGISVVQMKVLVAAIAAFVAGVGGGVLAIAVGVALPTNYTTLGAQVWLAVLVTQGIRSNGAALVAGLFSTVLPGVALSYLPSVLSNFVPILFGLGAIAMVKFPEGVLTQQVRQVRSLGIFLRRTLARVPVEESAH